MWACPHTYEARYLIVTQPKPFYCHDTAALTTDDTSCPFVDSGCFSAWSRSGSCPEGERRSAGRLLPVSCQPRRANSPKEVGERELLDLYLLVFLKSPVSSQLQQVSGAGTGFTPVSPVCRRLLPGSTGAPGGAAEDSRRQKGGSQIFGRGAEGDVALGADPKRLGGTPSHNPPRRVSNG